VTDCIIIEEPEYSPSRNRIFCKIIVPKEIKKFFKTTIYFAEYDTSIIADQSICNIPTISTILPIAWLTGYDIYVKQLDQSYIEAVEKLGSEFSKIYPDISFKTKINTDSLSKNICIKNDEKNTGLLFSGGVDATYSFITNQEENLIPLMIQGVDGRHDYNNYEYWDKVISTYSNYFNEQDINMHVIRTNPLEILHERRIEHSFHKELFDGTLWARLQHSLVLLSVTAPLSIGRFNKLMISASHCASYDYINQPYASSPSLDECISWADLRVKHEGYINTCEKIFNISEYYCKKNHVLRVCNTSNNIERINCGTCGKCIRTILPLLLSGNDPNKFGFMFDETSVHKIQEFFMKEKFNKEHIKSEWIPIQEKIPDVIDYDQFGSKKFFEWFKSIDLWALKMKNYKHYRNVYYMLPFSFAKCIDEFYKLISINIHEHTPYRETPAKKNKNE
jgi:hypothetical protein